MEKKDISQPLDRKNQQSIQEPLNLVERAPEDTLKNRKILKIKPFGQAKTPKVKTTTAVFNITQAPQPVKSIPVTGQLDLSASNGSNSFFKQAMKSGISGEIQLNSGSASLDFFKGTKAQSEAKQPGEKKGGKQAPGENKILGNFVAKNGIGEGLFANKEPAAQTQDKPQTQTSFFGNTKPTWDTKNSLFGGMTSGANPADKDESKPAEKSKGLFDNLVKSSQASKKPAERSQAPAQETQKEAAQKDAEAKAKFPIDQSKFKDPTSKSLFDKPLEGSLFGSELKKSSTGLFSSIMAKTEGSTSTGLFSSVKAKADGSGSLFSGGLFSKLNSGDTSSFFKQNTAQAEDDETDKEAQEKEESVEPKKVEMKVKYESAYETVASSTVRDFKEQAVGSPPPDSGFGNGSVSLEARKQKEKDQSKGAEAPKVIMFVYRNQAKLVKHESILIPGVSVSKMLKSRKDAILMLTFKNCVKSGQSIKYWVKILFNEDKEAADFLEKVTEACK